MACALATSIFAVVAGCGRTLAVEDLRLPPSDVEDLGSPPSDAGMVPVDAAQTTHEGDPDGSAEDSCLERCDDGDPCNGIERCEGGSCVPGVPPCVNEQPDHCTVTCISDGQRAHCEHMPRDADGDGHGDALCSHALVPGDDCDDARASVYPNATELCDGLDNDCDGLLDMEDGFRVVLPIVLGYIPGAQHQVAWAEPNMFGLSYARDGEVFLAALDGAGRHLFEDVLLYTGSSDEPIATSIASDGRRFAVGWATPHEMAMRFVARDGSFSGPAVMLGEPGQSNFLALRLAAMPGETTTRWASLYLRRTTNATLFAHTIADDGSLGPIRELLGPAVGIPRVVRGSDGVAFMTWLADDSALEGRAQIVWRRLDEELLPLPNAEPTLATHTVPSGVTDYVMASSKHGYAVAWLEENQDHSRHLWFMEFDGEGEKRCGPVDLGANDTPPTLPIRPYDMAFAGNAYALLGAEVGTNTYVIVQVQPGCRRLQRFPLTAKAFGENPEQSLVAAPHGFLFTRSSGTVILPTMFDVNFCRHAERVDE